MQPKPRAHPRLGPAAQNPSQIAHGGVEVACCAPDNRGRRFASQPPGEVRLGRIRRQAESGSGRVLRERPVCMVKFGTPFVPKSYWPVRHAAPHNGVCADGPVNGFQRPSPSRSGGLVLDNVVVVIRKGGRERPKTPGCGTFRYASLHACTISRERWYIIVATEVP